MVAVFGLHFANVETVAWFGSIAEVVAGVLGLAAVLAFLQFRDTGRARWAWTAIVVYGLALGANPTAAPIIGAFVLLDVWRFARGAGRSWSAHWVYVPLMALAGAYLGIEAAALSVAAGSGGYGYGVGPHLLLNALWYPVVLVAPFTEPELFDVHRALHVCVLEGTGSLADVAATASNSCRCLPHILLSSARLVGSRCAVRDGLGWRPAPHWAFKRRSFCSAGRCFTLPISLQLFF